MPTAIADTHTAIWYLFSDSRLGRAASECIDEEMVNGNPVGISAISLAEMIYLIEKSESRKTLWKISLPPSPIQRLFFRKFHWTRVLS